MLYACGVADGCPRAQAAAVASPAHAASVRNIRRFQDRSHLARAQLRQYKEARPTHLHGGDDARGPAVVERDDEARQSALPRCGQRLHLAKVQQRQRAVRLIRQCVHTP